MNLLSCAYVRAWAPTHQKTEQINIQLTNATAEAVECVVSSMEEKNEMKCTVSFSMGDNILCRKQTIFPASQAGNFFSCSRNTRENGGDDDDDLSILRSDEYSTHRSAESNANENMKMKSKKKPCEQL